MTKSFFEEVWYKKLESFIESDQFKKIRAEVARENAMYLLTPDLNEVFRAFVETPYDSVRVVMLGLDPYPKQGVADGLAFSARRTVTNPPSSLQYMINAMEKDVYDGFGIGRNSDYDDPDLTRWAKQGVLLLNAALTTRVNNIGVHVALWHPFIREVFRVLQDTTGLIYILLGEKAKSYMGYIDTKRNHVLIATHPNYAYHKGLKEWDCKEIFSKTNALLEIMNGKESQIVW